MVFAFLRPVLAPLSLLYWAGLRADRFRSSRRAARLQRPVISIGNITVGGTGKTPLLIRLCEDLMKAGRRPAVLTRGYRGLFQGSGTAWNDEAVLLSNRLPNLPVGSGPDRAAAARRLESDVRPDMFVLDDGFQHWRLHRDLDIVCVDATNPWGGGPNGWLLPAGRLREPVSALSRAGAVVITRAEQADAEAIQEVTARIQRYVPADRILVSRFVPEAWRAESGGFSPAPLPAEVVAVSGIGHPEAFERTLSQLGARFTPLRFGDHHAYTGADLDRIDAATRRGERPAAVTEKDWVKLRALSALERILPLYVVKVDLRFDPESEGRWQSLLKTFS